MDRILNYIVDMLPYMIIAMPIIILVRYFTYYNKINKKINWGHEGALFLFLIFIFGLASQTIIPRANLLPSFIKNISKVNLIPFKVLTDTYIEVFKNNNINYFLINFLGNIIMFVPIGFFVPLLWNINDKKVILIGFFSSLFIEFTQLFIGRTTDIDDLILNTFGAVLGLIIYNYLSRKFKKIINKIK